ncbi:transposase [Parasedimentitalea psychrophila]|uniref:Transposase n=1 Tax=Parasedimentitalea psychrophila TaxID=2997337 RepID=A0A9Y2KXN2_9RHOB|nr:transposase [Parasedimentitalea psychrophila]WIY24205.1 transposase [Parasedimentitalea psychrophila]
MTDKNIAQSEPVLVAIDISKARHEVLIAVPGKKRRRRLTVLNQLDDFNRLIATLSDYNRPVRVAFEATGNYHRALAYHLAAAGFEMKLVSSVALARTREALHNSWDKNDPKDAQVILHMMEIGNEQFYHDPLMRGTNDIQELSKTHDIVSKSKTELWHRILTHYLPLYFPEADRFHRSSRSDWFFAFLERYPSPHLISAMGKEEFIADAWTVVGRRVSKERLLADIYETAKTSVGLPVDADSDALRMFRLVLAEGRGLIAQRNHCPVVYVYIHEKGDREPLHRIAQRRHRLPVADLYTWDWTNQRPDHPGRSW